MTLQLQSTITYVHHMQCQSRLFNNSILALRSIGVTSIELFLTFILAKCEYFTGQENKRKMVESAFGEDGSRGTATKLTVEDLRYLFMV